MPTDKTPTITVADEAGACYGVNRALQMVQEAAAEARDKGTGPINTLGPLIHNPTVVSQLEAQGIGVADHATDKPGGTLLLRTHGVTPAEEAAASKAHDQVLDATCPFVIRAHNAAEKLTREGYQVIVLGEAGHPEVEGTVGHAPDALVVSIPEDLASATIHRKVGVVVQTTQSRKNLRLLVEALIGRCEELRVIDTICEATTLRQAAAARLAKESDAMVVIGGRNSANTTRLAQICSESCKDTHHIELPTELEATWFQDALRIGITAGASTPQSQINAVVARIQELAGSSKA